MFAHSAWLAEIPSSQRTRDLKENLKFTVLASRSNGTTQGYLRAFQRWKEFASTFLQVNPFPANPFHLAVYLQHLIDTTQSISSINCAFYALNWVHAIAGIPSPTEHPFVVTVKAGASRLLSGGQSHRKEPMEVNYLKELADKSDLEDLLQLRNLVMYVLAFSGFLRSSELCFLRSKDLTFNEGYLSIFIRQSKTDQLRDGHKVIIARSGSEICPVKLLHSYMLKAGIPENSNEFLFRPITSSNKQKKLIAVNRHISYSTYRGSFKKSFQNIVPDISKFSTHSNRSGGATSAANSGIPDRNFQRHGRWKSVKAKDGYVKDSIASRLEVSNSLGL